MTKKKDHLCTIALQLFDEQSLFALHRYYHLIIENTVVSFKDTIVIHKTQP